jgi:hypothetical protein
MSELMLGSVLSSFKINHHFSSTEQLPVKKYFWKLAELNSA